MTEYRFEFKYLLSPVIAAQVEAWIRAHGMSPDPYAPSGSYPVSSLYFDNFQKNDYADKSGGFRKRVKIRARSYQKNFDEHTDKIWLELKEKDDTVIKKIRLPLALDRWHKFLTGGPSFLLNDMIGRERQELYPILWEIVSKGRRPIILVRYLRRPYLAVFEGQRIRLTFDFGLEAKSVQGVGLGPDLWYSADWVSVEPRKVIVEIKFAKNLPSWFGDLIKYLELERTGMSKYARAIEAIRWYQTIPR